MCTAHDGFCLQWLLLACFMYAISCLGLRYGSPGRKAPMFSQVRFVCFKMLYLSAVLFPIENVATPCTLADVVGNCPTNNMYVLYLHRLSLAS